MNLTICVIDFDLELGAEQHIIFQIRKRMEQKDENQLGIHLYILRIQKSLTRLDYHKFDKEHLQEIHRKMVNGVSSLGSVSNRQFFSKYFTGGVRLVSVQSNNDFPTFTLEYILFSHFDNLDVKVKKNLLTRVKLIDSSLTPIFEYVGLKKNTSIETILPDLHVPELSTEMKNKLGYQVVNQIQNLEYQRPRFFGQLFKGKKVTL